MAVSVDGAESVFDKIKCSHYVRHQCSEAGLGDNTAVGRRGLETRGGGGGGGVVDSE